MPEETGRKNTKEQVKALTEKLETGIKDVFRSGKYHLSRKANSMSAIGYVRPSRGGGTDEIHNSRRPGEK